MDKLDEYLKWYYKELKTSEDATLNRPTWDELFMNIAILASKRSKDPHTKVGACLVKDGHIIGIGYNGKPKTCNYEFDWASKEKYDWVIHAEMNAIANANNVAVSCDNAIMYVTSSPCHDCMKMIAQFGIKHVYYLTEYSKDIELSKLIAKSCNITMTKLII